MGLIGIHPRLYQDCMLHILHARGASSPLSVECKQYACNAIMKDSALDSMCSLVIIQIRSLAMVSMYSLLQG